MKKYTVEFSNKASKQFYKLDRFTYAKITSWIIKNLEGCENPRLHGKALVGDLSGMWRYRVGDYRLIADIMDEKILIYILEVGHRKNIYE